MHDTFKNGMIFRTLNINDDLNHENLQIIMDTSPTSSRVIRKLDQIDA
jgi:hypothetical protein